MNFARLAEPQFSGRNQELEQLQKYLELATQGRGTTIFISGEAGAGKTRLVNEFFSLARKKPVEIISGYCLSTAAVPYFPFIEAFNGYFTSAYQHKSKHATAGLLGIIGWLKGTESTEAEQLGIRAWLTGPKHKEKHGLPKSLSPEMRKNLTYAAVADELKSICAEIPVILFLDDLQWADSASLSLLHYVSRLISSSRILIIGTFRSEEISPVSEGHPHPLVETLRLMSREDLYVEIRLSSLGEPDVAKLAQSMIGGPIDQRLIEKLTKESQGNPLFAIESLRLLSESKNLVQENEKWRLSADKLAIPTKVKDVILRRLNGLNSTQRRLLDLASVAGERIDPTILGSVLAIDKLVVIENLDQISNSVLLISPSDNAYTFGHAMFREVLYEQLSSPLRREYHTRVAETMENEGRTKKESAINALFFHYEQAGDKEKSVHYALLAGEDALKRFSNAEAINYFTYVMNAIPDDEGHSDEKILATEGLGDASYAVGSFEKAKNTFEKLAETAKSGPVRLRAMRKTMAASFHLGDMVQMIELANRAENDAGSDPLEHARIQSYKAQAMGFRGQVKEAISDLEECLQVFQRASSLQDTAYASREISEFYSCEYRGEEAIAAINRSVELYTSLKDPYGLTTAHFYEGLIHFNCGHCREALDSFNKSVETGERIGDYTNVARSIVYSGMVHESLGELEEALAYSLKSVECAEKTDSHYIQLISYANVTRNYAKLGDLEHMEEYYKEFNRLFIAVGRTASRLAYAGGVRTQATFYATKGLWDEANKHFEACIDLYKGAMWANLHEAMARTEYALILAKQGRIAEANTQIEDASSLYTRNGNNAQIARLNKLRIEINKDTG